MSLVAVAFILHGGIPREPPPGSGYLIKMGISDDNPKIDHHTVDRYRSISYSACDGCWGGGRTVTLVILLGQQHTFNHFIISLLQVAPSSTTADRWLL